MDIVLYPDPRLRAKNAPVTNFDEELEATTREMFKLMYATKGVGLAAPQVGLNIRLMVYNPSGSEKKTDEEVVLCNPKIVWKSKVKEDGQEGCLSFLSICGQVTRPIAIKVQAQGLNGEPVEVELEEWEARIFQHELDHLDGILFIDRMSLASKSLVKGDLEDMVQEYKDQLASS